MDDEKGINYEGWGRWRSNGPDEEIFEPMEKRLKMETGMVMMKRNERGSRGSRRKKLVQEKGVKERRKPPKSVGRHRTSSRLTWASRRARASTNFRARTLVSDSGNLSVAPEVAATTDGGLLKGDAPTGAEPSRGQDPGMGRASAAKQGSESDLSVGSIGDLSYWLDSRLDVLFRPLCKAKTMGRVFPLPAPPLLLSQLFPNSSQVCRNLLRVLACSLNSMYGDGGDCERASEYQTVILAGLMEDCARVEGWCINGTAPSWGEFFKVKGVDYKGDEVLTAQPMRWENVRSALPAEVGGVPLEEVVEKGCHHYVMNFEDYLLDAEDQVPVKPPRVMVPPDAWEEFCRNLLEKGIFSMIHEDDVYRVKNTLLLNGLFGVSKQEYDGQWESMRIIMNMVPVNSVCRGIEGDVSTLPSWAGMSPLSLEEGEELVVSSEDVRCFFYIFKVPEAWHRFLAFNRPLPSNLGGAKPGRWYPCSAVLPMGFKNSVSLAQHVHRVIVQKAVQAVGEQGGEAELRKDKPYPRSNPVYRIYLDNFDQLTKVSSEAAEELQGSVSSLVQGLRDEYLNLGVPRHPKKSVQSQTCAEVQGAQVDGRKGMAHPKVEKVLKYAHLSRLLLEEGKATQKQMQIVGGGLVYMAMFRRPLLGSLNHIWQFILQFEGYPPCIKFSIPDSVRVELIRFLGLIPLVYMDFRAEISPFVTASDASQTGGGVTVSTGLTPEGAVAKQCSLRGDIVEPADVPSVLTVGLFDGIGALRVAADALGWNVAGHISVEKSPAAQRVVESKFPNCLLVKDVQAVDEPMVKEWARRFSQVALVLIGGGPPCQGVSGLNAARKGALRDARSCLFSHVARIRELVKRAFPWAQVRSLMENVASMDKADQDVMTDSFGSEPWHIDAEGVSLAHRPRLYWLDWELLATTEAVAAVAAADANRSVPALPPPFEDAVPEPQPEVPKFARAADWLDAGLKESL
eukprot:s2009_g2.t1